jgi:uracil-DNA glycosylase
MIKTLAKNADINVHMKQSIPDRYESQKQSINLVIDCFYRFFWKKIIILFGDFYFKITTEKDNFTWQRQEFGDYKTSQKRKFQFEMLVWLAV